MKRFTPLAISLSFAFSAVSVAHADSGTFGQSVGVDEGLAAGLDMMLLNSSLLRHGDNLWDRARQGFQLTEVNPELVQRHERLYASRAEYFRRTLERSHKYLFHIMNEVERRGMPTEIALLPVVESAFVPTARSGVGAAGLWQFMPATGRQYGLEQTWWYDGRRDVVDATRAALDYLQNLYAQFGDWNLALAAYNWGEGNLSRAIARVQASGQTPTFENIRMPNETRNYVPKLLAVRNLINQPEQYGLRLDKFPNKPYFVAVSTGRHMDIDIAAKLAGISVAEFKELNPGFNLPVYAYKPGRQMLLPASKADRFEANLEKWNKPLLTWQVYTPTSTESAADVASQHGMTTSELLAVNKVHSGTLQAGRPVLVAMRGNNNAPLEGGDNLMQDNSAVMVASAKPAVVRTPAAQPLIVVQRDKPVTVAEVAKPVSAPKAVAPVMLAKADTTISSTPATSAPTATPTVTAPITTAQAPASQVLPAAQTTTIPAAATIVTARAETVQVAKVAEPVKARPVSLVKVAETRVARINPNASQHTVAAGDTLYNISRRYNISVADLKALNQLNEDVVKLGQVLKVKGNAQTLVASRTTEAGNSAQDDALLKVSGLQATRVPATGATPSTYVVQRGDTVYSIARRFGVNHADIQRWNGAGQVARLQPGQQVRIEVQGL